MTPPAPHAAGSAHKSSPSESRSKPWQKPWPRLGLGCAALGSPDLADADVEAVIAKAIERGIRFFDVAPLYGGGLAECRLGRALRGLPRDDYVLCTKTGVTRAFGQGPIPPGGTRPREADVWNYSERVTHESVARSLERLGVERLDIVHLHDAENHLDTCLEAWTALDALRDAGAVGGIGIGSNLPEPVDTLLDCAQFDTFLIAGCRTLLNQSGAALLDRAHRLGIPVVAGGAFNSGVLAAWPPTTPAMPTFHYLPAPVAVLEQTERIANICARHGVPLGAAALQFVVRHPAVATLLIGPRSIAELEMNLAAVAHPIPEALWTELETVRLLPPDTLRADARTGVGAVHAD